jgi:type IV secretion system protein VirB6
MNSWQFFGYIYQHLDTQIMGALNPMVVAASQAAQRPLLAALTLWLALTAADDLLRPTGDPMRPFIRRVIRAAVVMTAVTAATYTTVFANELLNDIPNGVSQALAGATGGQQVTANAFDQLWGSAWAAGDEVYKNIGAYSLKGVALTILVGLYWIAAIIAVGIAFLVYVLSHVMLGAAVALGPFFVALFLFDYTRKFFEGWIAVALALVVTQVLVVTLLALLIGIENEIVREIAASGAAAGVNANDVPAELHYLLEAGACYALLAFLAMQIPSFAARIMNGVAPDVRAISSKVHGAVFTPVRAGARAAAPQAARAARAGVSAGARVAVAAARAI